MIKEVAERARELILIEMEGRSKHGLGPIFNMKTSAAVHAAVDLAYEMVRGPEDPEQIPIAIRFRARDLALGIA